MKTLEERGTGRAKRIVQWVRYALIAFGILALGYCAAVFLQAKFFEAREARNFARELQRNELAKAAHRSSPMRAVTPAPPVAAPVVTPKDGGVIGKLEIPRIGVSLMVVQGVDDGDLKRAAGHIPGTALPWQPGNVGIAAHRDTFFRPLRDIQRNDVITVSTLEGAYRYRVVSTKIVKPDDVQVLYPTGRDTLTLVTCFPFYYIGSAPDRFIVRAERVPG